MLEMASLGSKVLHSRAVEFAKKYNVNLVVRSSFNNTPGTLVAKEDEDMEKFVVSGVTSDRNQTRITIMGVPDKPGIAAKLFNSIADANILVDMIVQNISTETKATDISFTVPVSDNKKALRITRKISDTLGAKGVNMNTDVAKVSIVGVGMRSHFGVAAKMFEILSEKKVNIMMISTSEIKISCIVDEKYMVRAVKALHSAFIPEEKVK
jgi:aspartate kinase